MFSNYIWQTYLNAGGKDVVEMFKENLTDAFSENYIESVCKLHAEYCPSKAILADTEKQLRELAEDIRAQMGLLDNGEYTINSALDFLYDGIKGGGDYSPQDIFACFTDNMEYYTTFLAIELPELFIPYYFKCNFNVLETIAQAFEIELPAIPAKKDYQGRFYYYGSLCTALYDFRAKYNLSPYELCAFLYDFATQYIGGTGSYIIKELPESKGAYFIGGSKNDRFLADVSDNIICWQCNPDTCAGDMIVMYLKAPVSAIDSIWRSVSVGFNDPFFYYYRCTYISNPIKTNRISQKQIQADEILGILPIVRKNMQGINGIELRPSEYNHIVDLSASNAKKLKFVPICGNPEITNEKDVENKLIKPLIIKLGYSEADYVQQLYMEIGNHNHALIPDFVLLPVATKGHRSAFAIIEAKHSITGAKAFEDTKIQARSYAVLLKVKYSVIASMEKIWIFAPSDDFSNEIFSAKWDELNDADVFSKIYKLLGKRETKKQKPY